MKSVARILPSTGLNPPKGSACEGRGDGPFCELSSEKGDLTPRTDTPHHERGSFDHRTVRPRSETSVAASHHSAEFEAAITNMHDAREKGNWRILPGVSTRVLLIGDSNLRAVDHLPTFWEAHALPGARFGHVLQMIENATSTSFDHVECAYVLVGINHRDDRKVPAEQMRAIVDRLHGMNVHAAFVGVSYAGCLSGRARLRLDELNQAAASIFDSYVPPLHPREVTVNQREQAMIHIDYLTLGRVISAVQTFHQSHTEELSRRARDVGQSRDANR